MFNSIGWPEVVLIAFAALFIFGPERLPWMAKEAASGLTRVRAALSEVRGHVDATLGEDLADLRDLSLRRHDPKAWIRDRVLRQGSCKVVNVLVGMPGPVQSQLCAA